MDARDLLDENEDSGGPRGYAEKLEILRDRELPEHAEIRAWIGKRFHPEAFDQDEVARRVRKIR